MDEAEPGVSIVICCHNSAERLPETLAHLLRQQTPPQIAWEVLVVDNASTDGTPEVAASCWPAGFARPLRIVHERRIGASHARRRGIQEARHEIISFIDDDNWVSPDWVRLVMKVMSEHPEVGLCGGASEPVCQRTPPPWFAANAHSYAASPQAEQRGWCVQLWTAGMSIRKRAWQQLMDAGFDFVLVGREGGKLTAGEDSELCLAMALADWKLWYEPELCMRHFIPSSRLTWDHLRKLYRGFGAARVYLPLYDGWWEDNDYSRTAHLSWLGRLLFSLRDLYGKPRHLFAKPAEGDPQALYAEWSVGFFRALLGEAFVYARKAQEIQRVSAALRRGPVSSSTPPASW